MNSILVVDDELSMREFLEIVLTKEGYAVHFAASGEEACTTLDKEAFDLVITDIRMDDIDGLGVLRKVREVNSETRVIIISAFATAETAVEAMKDGAYDYIPKPFNVSEFKKIVRDALQRKTLAKGQDEEEYHFGCLIGESPQMKRTYDLIRKVASTKTNILISGESGTGKELVARAIHGQSPRKDQPFVVINCAGIPETLIESELFGYKKGAFTGANTDKGGLFEAADGGTVFFDEIGELTPAIQVKLLRVIQEKTFTRIGETEERQVDVRLERKGDLPLLAQHFLGKYSQEQGKEINKLSAYAMDILSQYPFPGNVRELENIIERSVALETSNIVLPQSLSLSNFKKGRMRENRRRTDLSDDGIKLDKVMAELEKDYILRALDMAHGSKQRTARLLGITMRSLRYRMNKLGLEAFSGELP
jgi:two-component system response regulator PilR (NtrC family)